MSEMGIVVCPILTPVFVLLRRPQPLRAAFHRRPAEVSFCHRTNTGPGIRQTATHVSDRTRYRRPAGRIIVCVIGECARLPDQAGEKNTEVTADEVPAAKSKHQRRNTLKSSAKDQAEGTFHQLKGAIKETAGKLNDNPKLEAEGTGEKIAGKVQEKIGQVKKVFGK